MRSTLLGGLLVESLAQCVKGLLLQGKLDEDDLERALSDDARAWIDHSIATTDWASHDDAQGLAELVAEQLGGAPGLVEWSDEIVREWLDDGPMKGLVDSGRRLVDGPGFVAAHASEALLQGAVWDYEGNRDAFSVRLRGVENFAPELKSLLGSCLARLAEAAGAEGLDVRFEGVDEADLIVFGERLADGAGANEDELARSRLARAALVPALGA